MEGGHETDKLVTHNETKEYERSVAYRWGWLVCQVSTRWLSQRHRWQAIAKNVRFLF